MILLTLTLTIISVAAYSRYIRSNMLEVINSITSDSAFQRVTLNAASSIASFKNAALPLATLIGLDSPFCSVGR
ncbi:MAG: hypothetical protein R3E39_17620 [Anaerolineae bacterium]